MSGPELVWQFSIRIASYALGSCLTLGYKWPTIALALFLTLVIMLSKED